MDDSLEDRRSQEESKGKRKETRKREEETERGRESLPFPLQVICTRAQEWLICLYTHKSGI